MGLDTPTTQGIDRVASIERLRERSKTQVKRLKNATIAKIVIGLRDNTSLKDLMKQTRLSETEILDIVAGLGTWLIHVHGSVPETAKPAAKTSTKSPVRASTRKETQLSLLDILEKPKSAKVVTPKGSKPKIDEDKVPPGFEKSAAHRRDVVKSVGSIIYHNPSNSEITRWLDRRYMSTSGVLTGADVTLMHLMAQLGRLSEMGAISPSPAAAQAIVGAFDLFDVAICDANEAVSMLSGVGRGEINLSADEIMHNATKMAWLNEARSSKIFALARQAKEFADRESLAALNHDLRSFSFEAESIHWHPKDIASLRRAQVARLIERSGLAKSEDLKRTESEIRNKLVEMGLKDDLDRLLSDAMRAVHAKCESEFWAAITARQSGDANWRARLQKAITEATEAMGNQSLVNA